jgi:hypothetical protein
MERLKSIEEHVQSRAAPPLQAILLLDAKRHMANDDFTSAFLYGAIACEVNANLLMRKLVVAADAALGAAITKLTETSQKAAQIEVILGLLKVATPAGCTQTIKLRNKVMHGKRPRASREEAASAIRVADELSRLLA